ncbi:hypothetical protein ACIRBY_25690 [Streptomyces sp. NPDC096136]|uniref:hypothetical protein n=1 Tax=Streptomyces sp. NPDC096136 TaxID=3366076 RepID=UPI003811D401
MTRHTMRRACARTVTGLGLTLALATGGLLTAAGAHAQPVSEGTVSFDGDQGDYISGGGSYAYTAGKDQIQVNGSAGRTTVGLSISGANGDWWSLSLAAPAGRELQAGTYEGATRYPFNDGGAPGLSHDGNGRGCNTLTGSFTISKITWGPNGYVEALDAAYEQHCEGGAPALRGRVHIQNPAPPAALSLGVGVSVEGRASALNGRATVNGKVSCNKPVQVDVSGLVTQVKRNTLIRGPYSATVACVPGAPVAWSAEADPTGATPFQSGDVEVKATATAYDSDYRVGVTASDVKAVHLTRVKQ